MQSEISLDGSQSGKPVRRIVAKTFLTRQHQQVAPLQATGTDRHAATEGLGKDAVGGSGDDLLAHCNIRLRAPPETACRDGCRDAKQRSWNNWTVAANL